MITNVVIIKYAAKTPLPSPRYIGMVEKQVSPKRSNACSSHDYKGWLFDFEFGGKHGDVFTQRLQTLAPRRAVTWKRRKQSRFG